MDEQRGLQEALHEQVEALAAEQGTGTGDGAMRGAALAEQQEALAEQAQAEQQEALVEEALAGNADLKLMLEEQLAEITALKAEMAFAKQDTQSVSKEASDLKADLESVKAVQEAKQQELDDLQEQLRVSKVCPALHATAAWLAHMKL